MERYENGQIEYLTIASFFDTELITLFKISIAKTEYGDMFPLSTRICRTEEHKLLCVFVLDDDRTRCPSTRGEVAYHHRETYTSFRLQVGVVLC